LLLGFFLGSRFGLWSRAVLGYAAAAILTAVDSSKVSPTEVLWILRYPHVATLPFLAENGLCSLLSVLRMSGAQEAYHDRGHHRKLARAGRAERQR
jgi:hypothetical protein